VHGRDQDRGNRVVAEVTQSGGAAEFLVADLASLAEVRRFGETVWQRTDRLDILINNAGIGTAGAARQTSADGHELRFAVNYLAGFLLTHLLLPLLRRSAPARIVNVASAGQQPIDFADVMLTRGYSGARAYCQSKLAQIMFTIDLAEALAGTGVTVNVLVPGGVTNTPMVPLEAGYDRTEMIQPAVMAPPLNWLVSDAAAGVTGQRFLAVHWNPSLPSEEAAAKAGAPVAWTAIATMPIEPPRRN
jgi:NAD(P)-dependent dehydrogenase (short-subunit alcohol dehydrogenase family)